VCSRPTPFGEGGVGELCRPAAGVCSPVRNIKTSGELMCTRDSGRPRKGIPKILKLASLKSECHAIMNKYPEAVSVVQKCIKDSVRQTLSGGWKFSVNLYCE
jgi:hypothetical protein